MRKLNLILSTCLLFLFANELVIAQESEKKGSSFYTSAQNKYYWKNNLPRVGYWQQDVHYEIDAFIDDKKDLIEGRNYKLVYTNNSPNALNELYFHLIDNAFQPGSYYDNLVKNNKVKPKYGHYEAQKLNITVENVKVNGEIVVTQLDNTVFKVVLNKPVLPNEQVTVTLNFKTYFDTGSLRRRLKKIESFGTKQFNGVHWYPSICVYDNKFGWTTDQHLDKEFYNNFGSFDVSLTFPQEYIVEATGDLLNRSEVMSDSLRQKLDIKNFKDKPMNSAPSIIIPKEEGKYKTWKYHADNVHNFAFTADPLYRIGEVEWNGIKCISLAQEPHASKWQRSAWFASRVIQVYSTDFGMYEWPKIIVADAQDGMEYPMITLDNGTYPQHQSLLAHEIGHMWFYGMLGSNETYRAFLDEGFTQFLTVWAMNEIENPIRARVAKNKYVQKFVDSLDTRYENIYYPYLNTVHLGFDEPLNTHSSAFNGALRHGGSYGLVYYKTATMLYNMQYVLGDSLFLKAMQHYVDKWKFKHPYPEDFRQTIIDFTKIDLNWFFDQWLETTKYIDYGIKSVKKTDSLDYYNVTFKRTGRMHMPIDFTVVANDGKTYEYHIPITWYVKDTKAQVLPKWYGWDLLQPEYIAKIKVESGVKNIIIDPQNLLADIDKRDNYYKSSAVLKFDSRIGNVAKWKNSEHFIRPDIWYNNFDGLQLGVHANGNYFGLDDIYSANIWLNTGVGQQNIETKIKDKFNILSCSLSVKKSLMKIWTQLSTYANFTSNAGLNKGGLGLEKYFRKQDARSPNYLRINISHDVMYRDNIDATYLLNSSEWSTNMLNSTVNLGIEKTYSYTKGNGKLNFDVRTPGIKSDFNYSYLQLSAVNNNEIKKLDIKTRFFARYGIGNTPFESTLNFAGANSEQLMNNKFTRATGFVPTKWTGYGSTLNHFQMGGGLNVRGLASYLVPDVKNGQTYITYSGKSGISGSVEVDFDKYIKIKPYPYLKYFHLDSYIFADAGVMVINTYDDEQKLSKLRANAGLGFLLTYKMPYLSVKPLSIRFDMPLWLNTTPATDPQFVKLRYVVGINRTF